MIRDLALELLDDDQGISAEAWKILQVMLEESGNGDIIEAVETADGRFFIDEDDRDVLES